jgi:hypothetical protein
MMHSLHKILSYEEAFHKNPLYIFDNDAKGTQANHGLRANALPKTWRVSICLYDGGYDLLMAWNTD